MAANLPVRRLIPKWRPVRTTLDTIEAAATPSASDPKLPQPESTRARKSAPSLSQAPASLEEFEYAVLLWQDSREIGVLGDILSFSIYAPLQTKILDIGTKAIRDGFPVTPAQRFVIHHLAQANGEGHNLQLLSPASTGKGQAQPFAEPIRRLRALLRTEPRNALALLDYAQLQAAIGRNDVAEKALRTALGAAPNNRLVLRTLARFYVHAGEHGQALQEIRRHHRTPHDPWLMASEISLADLAEKPSAFISKGRRMLLEAGKVPPASFTELAGSLAMAELAAGNLKKARELQRLALLQPTDNVAAQAVDRERQFGIALSAPNVARAIASSAEAQLLQSWSGLMPDSVEQHALTWHGEEPFSSRPIHILTALYAFQGQLQTALHWLIAGLRSDVEDRGLLTNLAYVQARLGTVDAARLTMLKTRRLHGAEAEPYMRATEGLIAYQQGRFDEGDRLYGEAAALLDEGRSRSQNVATFCLLNQALAALEYKHPNAVAIAAHANDALEKRPNPDASMLLRTNALSEDPDTKIVRAEDRKRLTTQWLFDRETNTLRARHGLTAPGASPVVLLNPPGKSK